MKTTRFHGALLAAVASLALAACGGGGGDAPPPQQQATTPPASASASSNGFLLFIASLAGQMFDGSEPLDLSSFTGPGDNVDAQAPIATSIDG